MTQKKEKKRHHYVPKAYLRAFCDNDGKLWAFAKDEPSAPFRASPGGIAHERYYYSQPLSGGGQENEQLENLFSTIESEWPPIVARWLGGDPANDKLEVVFQFIATMCTRIPAARDAIEAWLANSVKETGRHLERRGKLPPMPAELSRGWDDVVVSIDPHQSLHAMVPLIQGIAQVFDAIGLRYCGMIPIFRCSQATTRLHTLMQMSPKPRCYLTPCAQENDLSSFLLL